MSSVPPDLGELLIGASDVQVLSDRPLAAPQHRMIGVELTRSDGVRELRIVPAIVDADGHAHDGLASEAFRLDLLDAIGRGETFDLAGESAPAARQGADAGDATDPTDATDDRRSAALLREAVAAGAAVDPGNPWADLVRHRWTTRDRYHHVVEQSRILSERHADALVVTFFEHVLATMRAQPAAVQALQAAAAQRPRFGPVFYGYVQFTGVAEGAEHGTFDDLAETLDVIQGGDSDSDGVGEGGLGFDEIELLPFFESPQKDGGYDISDHSRVDPAVGGDAAFERFMHEAVRRGLRVTADLVSNHVSDQHAWVQALLAGDATMLRHFVVWDDAAKIGTRHVDDKIFNVFLHRAGEHAGKVSHVWQIFPDNNPDTFIVAHVGADGPTHQIYASFMNPYQWDVNAEDPEVLGYYLHTVGHYANLGQLGTRMDAIIHMGKTPGTFNIDNAEARAFMALAKAFAAHVAPGNIFLPEANLAWDVARAGWLDPERTFDGVLENTAGDVLISFDVHRALWTSLLRRDKRAWLDTQSALGDLPAHKSLLVYLGLHDETLIVDPDLRRELLARGFNDFAGRGVGNAPIELLAGDADRLAMAHVLLYGSKGHPAVYYRTVVGAPDDHAYYDAKVSERLADQRAAGQPADIAKATDSRDLDRGPIGRHEYARALAAGYPPAVTIRALNALWRRHPAVRTNDISEVANPDPGIVSIARRPAEGEDATPLLQLVNLTGERVIAALSAADLAAQLGWTHFERGARDLLASEIAGVDRVLELHASGDSVSVELAPYAATFLQLGRWRLR